MKSSGFAFADSDSEEDEGLVHEEDGSRTVTGTSDVVVPTEPKNQSRSRSHRRLFGGDKGNKNIDDFLTKIKEEQSRRAVGIAPERAPSPERAHGTLEHNDPITTNLFVGNLHPHTSEDRLQLVFGKFGPLSSVKIMWPRKPEDHERGHNSGFVCFMVRSDAERAHQVMHGACIDGHTVRIAWGKALSRVEQPMPCLPGQVWHRSAHYELDDAMQQGDDTLPIVVVQPPIDLNRRVEIDAAAVRFAKGKGNEFEKERIASEMEARSLDDATYFRWKTFSLSQNETATEWRTEKFAMFPGGPLWLPPPCSCPRNNPSERKQVSASGNAVLSGEDTHTEEAKAKLHEAARSPETQSLFSHLKTLDTPLLGSIRSEFEAILEALSTERESINVAMMFCIDHAESAGPLTAMIAIRAMSANTAVDKRLACVYLLSDILHNSIVVGLRGVWAFQTRFESIFDHLFSFFTTLRMDMGPVVGQDFQTNIALVLQVWLEWNVFSVDFLARIECVYEESKPCDMLPWSKLRNRAREGGQRNVSPQTHDYNTETRKVSDPGRDPCLGKEREARGCSLEAGDSSEDDIDGIPVDSLLK